MIDCKITILGEGKVRLILPEGMSRADFLQKVQSVSRKLYARDAIYTFLLQWWGGEKEFTAKPSTAVAIGIDGHVEGSTLKTRDEQVVLLVNQGLQMPDLCDLAVAHAAYFLATGSDLFRGNAIRGRDSAFCFYSSGLNLSDYALDGSRRKVDIAASACLPLGNDGMFAGAPPETVRTGKPESLSPLRSLTESH